MKVDVLVDGAQLVNQYFVVPQQSDESISRIRLVFTKLHDLNVEPIHNNVAVHV